MSQSSIRDTLFTQLFTGISPEEISCNVFKLGFCAITAGKKDHYNSMIGGNGFGPLFKKPTVWSLFRSDRYTLELLQREQTYTLSYFPKEYKVQVLFLGSESGRDSNKMKDVELTSMETPSGDMSFAEARLVIECRVTAIMTPSPADFCSQEAKDYIDEAYKEPRDYRKLVFGEITHVWVKK